MKKIIFLISFFLYSFFNSGNVIANEKIEIYFFWGQGCPHCEVQKPFLEKLKQKYSQLEVKDFEVYYNRENQELLQKLATAYKTSPMGVPMTFVGKDYLVGFGSEQTTGKEIEDLIQNCLQVGCPSPGEILEAGGIDKWQPSTQAPVKELEEITKESKICIHYFIKDECPQCQNLAGFLDEIAGKYEIEFHNYNVSENEEDQILYQKLQEFYGISFSGFPAVFLGDTYLVGDQSIRENIEKVVTRCQKDDCLCPVKEIEQSLKQIPKPSTFTPEEKEKIKISFFGKEMEFRSQSSLLYLGMILGLADGINPCTLSVLLFLLTYLLAIGSRKKVIKIGLVFVLGVFFIYLLFMFGLINLIALIGFIQKIKIAVAIIALIVGLIMIKDFFAYGKWLSLEIPNRFKPNIEKLIKKGTVLSALLLAALASLVELPCTAGIPLIYTALLAEKVESYLPHLIWYNIFYVIPLLFVVLMTALVWTQVDKIEKWRLNFRKYMRLIAGLILLFLAIALFKGWM